MIPSSSADTSAKDNYYKSQKSSGKLYRAARAVADAHPSEAEERLASRFWAVDGFERHLDAARQARAEYEATLLYLQETYGVCSEAELVIGRVNQIGVSSRDDSSVLVVAHEPKREAEEAIRRATYKLWAEAREQLESVTKAAVDTAGSAEEQRREKDRVAAAWYVVAHEAWAPSGAGHEYSSPVNRDMRLPSFGWVAWPELLAILKRGSRSAEVLTQFE